jgi:hypothetical protein
MLTSVSPCMEDDEDEDADDEGEANQDPGLPAGAHTCSR